MKQLSGVSNTLNVLVKETSQVQLEKIKKLLDESQWQEALDFIIMQSEKDLGEAFVLNAKAIIYANLGQLAQAVKFCEACLAVDATNIHAYFTLGMILIELNRHLEAEQILRRTLFLNRHFVIGHFQLGLLLIRNNQYQAGLKSLDNALTIAETKDPTEPVIDVQRLNYGQLVDILKHTLSLYTLNKRIL
jgi:tetratricopeptide (TPR) repeat protein